MFFFQLSETAKQLQEIFSKIDWEASEIFKTATNVMTIYNSQLNTLHKTKQLLKATMPEKEFKKWEGELVKRKPVQLKLLDVETVGIMNYLFFKNFLCFIYPNITKYFQTISNTFYIFRELWKMLS